MVTANGFFQRLRYIYILHVLSYTLQYRISFHVLNLLFRRIVQLQQIMVYCIYTLYSMQHYTCRYLLYAGQEKKESEDVDSPDLVNNPGIRFDETTFCVNACNWS